ncbi:homoserine/homoserine lactone efflux protein [Aliagarivorans marinus]|uniref:homoserine/homoserine lactone efflux protein n=1 Tax=Aliagarivorans marinus TaxID=561965 RepID=UPI00042894DB|nr:homoserine/homoserine lactone efflux protein [Aliagarivorans marinus]
MELQIWLTFVAACIIFSFAPGAGMVATVSNALNRGMKVALVNIVGLQLALVVHLLIVSLGLGALLAQSATAFTVVKYCGAAYLIYLGITQWFSKAPAAQTDTDNGQHALLPIMRQSLLINLSNPKSIVFLAAFLPQFIDPTAAATNQYLILGSTVVVIDCLVMVVYALLATVIRPLLSKPRFVAMQNKVFASLFVSLGVALAKAER